MPRINNKGFTLIELLVVVAIIGILIAVGSISYQRAVQLSRDSRRKTDLEQIRQALETYRSENSTYPVTKDLLSPDFINTVPQDPKVSSGYQDYTYTRTTASTYTLCTILENTDTPNYCVTEP